MWAIIVKQNLITIYELPLFFGFFGFPLDIRGPIFYVIISKDQILHDSVPKAMMIVVEGEKGRR